MAEVSDTELVQTIADFIEMGHIENIVAMFKQEKDYYRLVGELIQDERFIVRMGMVLLFEELKEEKPEDLSLSIPFLIKATVSVTISGRNMPSIIRSKGCAMEYASS